MEKIDIETASRYMDYLPALYQEGKDSAAFVGRYLKIFEKILSGIDDDISADLSAKQADICYDITRAPVNASAQTLAGIEQTIDAVFEFFDPSLAPVEFLKWLGGWVALVLRDDWADAGEQRPLLRRLLRRIVPLYRKRGTREGIGEYLRIFVGPNLELKENVRGIRVGRVSTLGENDEIAAIGRNTFVGGFLPHFFIAAITFTEIGTREEINYFRNSAATTKGVLDLEKPAHTYYALRLQVPGIYVGRRPPTHDAAGNVKTYKETRVGVNTIIGRTYPFFV